MNISILFIVLAIFFSLDFEYLINEYDGCEGP